MGNIYLETDGVPSSETERITHDFDYYNEVSTKVLSTIDFASIIDAGAGINMGIAAYAASRGAKYIAFDAGKSEGRSFAKILAGKLKDAGISGQSIYGDILNIPSEVGMADVVHERLVLVWLSEEERPQAIANLAKVSNRYLVLLENDWMDVSSSTHPRLIEQCKEIVFAAMTLTNLHPNMEARMPNYLSVLDTDWRWSMEKHPRPESDYSREMIDKMQTMLWFCEKQGKEQLATSFRSLIKAFSTESILMVPPVMFVVLAEKTRNSQKG